MRHKLAEISQEELDESGEDIPQYCFRVCFFDPDGITVIGEPENGLNEFPDVQTVQTFKVDINNEPEVISPSVTKRFKEEVVFGMDYSPDSREEQVTLYKHKKKDRHFADYEWYSSSVYIKPKVVQTHHKTTVFLYPEEHYISSITHEIEPSKLTNQHKVKDRYYEITKSENVITTRDLSNWDAKFTFDEDQLEMQLKELENFRNKLKHENIPTIYEGIGLDKNHPQWDHGDGNKTSHCHIANKHENNNNQKLIINTCSHLNSFADEINKKGDVTHRIADENSSFEDLPSPDYVDIEGVDGCSFEELDV